MAFEILVHESLNHPVVCLRNTEAHVEAEIYCFGALLNAFRLPFEQSTINLVAGFTSPEAAKTEITPLFRSAKLSPFVCRLNQGKYQLAGVEYKVEKYYLQSHALHALLYDAVFAIKETITDQESAAVVLEHHYDGSDNGYPFAFDMEVEWKLRNNNDLSVTTRVQHANTFSIPYADGWHPYFTLDTTIDECYLQIDSRAAIVFDDTMIPTGAVQPDVRFTEKRLLEGLRLDDCFVLDNSKSQPGAVLSSERWQLAIIPDDSYPYLQVYTPDDRKSIAIENVSGIADCFNNGIGLRWIGPNETARFTTHYVPAVIS